MELSTTLLCNRESMKTYCGVFCSRPHRFASYLLRLNAKKPVAFLTFAGVNSTVIYLRLCAWLCTHFRFMELWRLFAVIAWDRPTIMSGVNLCKSIVSFCARFGGLGARFHDGCSHIYTSTYIRRAWEILPPLIFTRRLIYCKEKITFKPIRLIHSDLRVNWSLINLFVIYC